MSTSNEINTVYIKIVEKIGDSIKPSNPKTKKLDINKNLYEIRKELEKSNINDINILLFSKKLVNEYSVTDREDEEKMILKELLFENSDGKFLYLFKSNSDLCYWDYLNKECKLDYGRTLSVDGNKKASKRAFEMKYCKFNLYHAEKYKKDRLEFRSKLEWMAKTNLFYSNDINVQDFAELGFSIETSQIKNFDEEINSKYQYTEIGKASLKFNKENLELTDEFKNDLLNAIDSKNSRNFVKIIQEYGRFIPTEIILGGRVSFKDDTISVVNKADESKEGSVNINSHVKLGINFSDSKKESSFCSSDRMRLIGGAHPEGKDFDDKAWIESLKDYQNWDNLLGKKILHTSIENYEYILNEPGKYKIVDISDEVSEILQNKEADCDIFATVIDTDESKNDFFNCQILRKQNEKPKIIIHGIQKKFKKCEYKLKIRIMVIGYDINFKFTSDVRVTSIKYIYDPYNQCDFYSIPLKDDLDLMTNNTPIFGIPVLENLDSSNDSLIIGHNFHKDNYNSKIDVFSYCLEKRCIVNLPRFTFILIALNGLTSNNYASLSFGFNGLKNTPFIDLKNLKKHSLDPKYISCCLSKENYKPFFLKQTINQIKVKYVDCICKKTCTFCKNKTSKIAKGENVECLISY
ncbi:hypothetical protein C1645_875651 [Glomus cerebriforme]|uniref:Uncharacterized protein n=1 Tax=Glomus cerebriforme TaxID=658196 RepID=A0A397T7R0_9GLOM|nr:hypothetical protein C1645_875651 [Glomus cerebriforme]